MEPRGCNRWQSTAKRPTPKTAETSETVAAACDQLPFGFHGKEGVDGPSPSEGSRKKARKHGALPRGELDGGEARNRTRALPMAAPGSPVPRTDPIGVSPGTRPSARCGARGVG